jgi:hypothetical protein
MVYPFGALLTNNSRRRDQLTVIANDELVYGLSAFLAIDYHIILHEPE